MKSLLEKIETLRWLGFEVVLQTVNTTEVKIVVNFPKNCVCRQWNELTRNDSIPTFTITTRVEYFSISNDDLTKAEKWIDEITEEYNDMYSTIMKIRELTGNYTR